MTRIRIEVGGNEWTATLDETPTAKAIVQALPCASEARTWGDEVYFEVGAEVDREEDARQVVDPGTVCYWVQGRAIAIPFGPTPASHGEECRLVTRVNVVGRIEGDPTTLGTIREGDPIRIEVLSG